MKVLFIGGTGIISSACSSLAVERGIDLYHLNRDKTKNIRNIEGVTLIEADIRDKEATREAIQYHHFDVVVDWICFTPEQLQTTIDLFEGKCKQLIFISSASAYQKPPMKLPITEDTPLDNPYWQYSRDKKACEELMRTAAPKAGMAYTIIRPSHTYDKTLIPMDGGYTVLKRMLDGKSVVIHGDGTSVWTMTHHTDFAKGLVGLFANPKAYNEGFHITSDEWVSWFNIYRLMAKSLGVELKPVFIPSTVIARYRKELGEYLLGDKMHSMIFDNSKIKSLVPDFNCSIPYEKGVQEIAEFYQTHPEWQVVDKDLDASYDRMIEEYSFPHTDKTE